VAVVELVQLQQLLVAQVVVEVVVVAQLALVILQRYQDLVVDLKEMRVDLVDAVVEAVAIAKLVIQMELKLVAMELH
tara:strand:+ start:287 stop:517 length:231 start_codon:yes stop_codon:yes gene_type:complete